MMFYFTFHLLTLRLFHPVVEQLSHPVSFILWVLQLHWHHHFMQHLLLLIVLLYPIHHSFLSPFSNLQTSSAKTFWASQLQTLLFLSLFSLLFCYNFLLFCLKIFALNNFNFPLKLFFSFLISYDFFIVENFYLIV